MLPSNYLARQLCALTILAFSLPAMGNPVSLMDLRWQHRLIVVFATEGSPEAQALQLWVDDNLCTLSERETLVFAVDTGQPVAMNNEKIALDDVSLAALAQKRQVQDKNTELLLIGKDGGIKQRASSTSALDSFVSEIDKMPMRKSEVAAKTSDRC